MLTEELQQRVHRRRRDGRAALAAHTRQVRDRRLSRQALLRLHHADEAHRNGDDGRRPPAFLPEPQRLLHRGRGVADHDEG